eukprot:1468142-Ditylum_brightwellii.AAC.1
MVDYSCCWGCIGRNGILCVEAVALCLYSNKDQCIICPSCPTVDAGYKLAKAAMNRNYTHVPAIPNHCYPPKGGMDVQERDNMKKM